MWWRAAVSVRQQRRVPSPLSPTSDDEEGRGSSQAQAAWEKGGATGRQVKTVGAWEGGGLPGVCLGARRLVSSSRARGRTERVLACSGTGLGPAGPVPSRARREEIQSVGGSSDGRGGLGSSCRAVCECVLLRVPRLHGTAASRFFFRVFFSHSHFFLRAFTLFSNRPRGMGLGGLSSFRMQPSPKAIPLPLTISSRGEEEEEKEEEKKREMTHYLKKERNEERGGGSSTV